MKQTHGVKKIEDHSGTTTKSLGKTKSMTEIEQIDKKMENGREKIENDRPPRRSSLQIIGELSGERKHYIIVELASFFFPFVVVHITVLCPIIKAVLNLIKYDNYYTQWFSCL